MLSHVIGVKTRLLVGLDQFQARLVKFPERKIVTVQMVEYAEFHISPDIS
jgi:hypothetical protein